MYYLPVAIKFAMFDRVTRATAKTIWDVSSERQDLLTYFENWYALVKLKKSGIKTAWDN